MTERPEGVPTDAADWRPSYLPTLPPRGAPWPVAEYVPEWELTSATTMTQDTVASAAPERGPLSEATPPPPTVTPSGEAPEASSATREKGERVELSGYVAGNPWFGTDRRGVPTCVFALATHPEPDSTVTWRIRAKRERAERLRGTVRRGDAVTVVGYLHREVLTRGGTNRPSAIVNLVALRT